MKKTSLLILAVLCLGINNVLAQENPSDKYKKQVTYPSRQNAIPNTTTAKPYTPQTNSDPKKAQLDSIARQMLKAGENHQDLLPYQKKFMQMGITEICPPQIISKRTPTCPPIKVQVNGRTLSGSTCAITCYKYNGKQHEVGYCK